MFIPISISIYILILVLFFPATFGIFVPSYDTLNCKVRTILHEQKFERYEFSYSKWKITFNYNIITFRDFAELAFLYYCLIKMYSYK